MTESAAAARVMLAGIGVLAVACADRDRRGSGSESVPAEEHVALAASFVSGDSVSLRRLLHPDLIVQPPTPDSAQQGAAAIAYLLDLAAHSDLTESRLEPRAVAPEGPFAFERGTWLVTSGGRRLRSSYILRWRASPEGWRVVLWRWGLFR